MDVLSHGFLPYATFALAGRPRHERVAAAVAGIAPDLDSLWAWSSILRGDWYPLQHRGFSHTVWGAPLLAVVLLWILSRPRVRNRWAPFANYELSRRVAPALLIGAWSHLVLDMTTITGAPALWPLLDGRYTVNWYFFSLWYMFLVCLAFWIPVWRGRASDRFVQTGLAVLVGILFAAGGVRYASYPDDLTGRETVTPGPLDWVWIVSERNDTGVVVYQTEWGARQETRLYAEPNRTEAARAIDACEETSSYFGWHWKLWGLVVVDAARRDDGGWDLVFFDSARLYSDDHGSSGALGKIFGRERTKGLECTVSAENVVIGVHRSGGFFG